MRPLEKSAKERPIVFVVDDDRSVREALGGLIRSVGLRVETFASAAEFLRQKPPTEPSCLVLDVGLPGLSGIDLQRELAAENRVFSIIFITGRGDIPTTVRAMKAGAVEFLTKPFSDQHLLDAIQQALVGDRKALAWREEMNQMRACYEEADAPRARSDDAGRAGITEQAGRGGAWYNRNHREDPAWAGYAQDAGGVAGRPGAHGREAGPRREEVSLGFEFWVLSFEFWVTVSR